VIVHTLQCYSFQHRLYNHHAQLESKQKRTIRWRKQTNVFCHSLLKNHIIFSNSTLWNNVLLPNKQLIKTTKTCVLVQADKIQAAELNTNMSRTNTGFFKTKIVCLFGISTTSSLIIVILNNVLKLQFKQRTSLCQQYLSEEYD